MDNKNKLKIIFLSINVFGRTIGGIENHIYYLSKALSEKGIEIDIVQPICSNHKKIEVESVGKVTVHRLYLKIPLFTIFNKIDEFHDDSIFGMVLAYIGKAKYILCTNKVVNYIKKLNPDVIHQHDYISNIFATKILAKKYITILTNHTGEYLFLNKWFFTRKIQEKLIAHFNFIIGPSKQLTPNRNNSMYIPNGVDTNFFYPLDEKEIELKKQKMGYNEKFIILCPRRWAPTKGIIYLAKAIKLLEDKLSADVIFLFAGSNYEGYKKYREKVFKILLGLNVEIKMLGNLDAIALREYYQISDLVIIPSLMEATSLSALESISCGCPVLCTKVGGMPDIIKENYNGWLAEPMDEKSLAHKIQESYEVLTNLYQRQRIRKNCREFVISQFSWNKIACETIKIYKKLSGINKL